MLETEISKVDNKVDCERLSKSRDNNDPSAPSPPSIPVTRQVHSCTSTSKKLPILRLADPLKEERVGEVMDQRLRLNWH